MIVSVLTIELAVGDELILNELQAAIVIELGLICELDRTLPKEASKDGE